MAEWFIQRKDEGAEEGPLRPSELLRLVREGEVTRTTKIRKGDSTWFEASEVGGLFEAALRPTIEYLCPGCEEEIPEPPTVCKHCGREVYNAITRITENTIAVKDDAKSNSVVSGAKRSVAQWLKRKGVGNDKDQ
ncbi:MAG: GYF domain-containing protein [Planctomycetota bacterium]